MNLRSRRTTLTCALTLERRRDLLNSFRGSSFTSSFRAREESPTMLTAHVVVPSLGKSPGAASKRAANGWFQSSPLPKTGRDRPARQTRINCKGVVSQPASLSLVEMVMHHGRVTPWSRLEQADNGLQLLLELRHDPFPSVESMPAPGVAPPGPARVDSDAGTQLQCTYIMTNCQGANSPVRDPERAVVTTHGGCRNEFDQDRYRSAGDSSLSHEEGAV